MGRKALQRSTFRTDKVSREEFATGKGEGMVRTPSSSAATSFSHLELESGREKEMAQERPAPLKLNRKNERKKACKLKKAPISPAIVPRRVKVPVIIYTVSPRVIRTDSSNFMWLVQMLTGLSSTRSRCEKKPQGSDDLMQAQTGTLAECATAEAVETEMFLAKTVNSETSNDEDGFVRMQSNLEEDMSDFPESANVALIKDDAASRSLLPAFDWRCPSMSADISKVTTFPTASFPCSYPDSLDVTANNFSGPIQEPICDLFERSLPFPTDVPLNSV